MHTFVTSSDLGAFDVFRAEEGREAFHVLRVSEGQDALTDFDELARLLCFLLDGLAVRDAEALPPADWVEIGTDDEDEDLYAEAYDDGFRDGYGDAIELVAEVEADEFDEDDEDDEGEYYHAKSYEEGFRDGSAAAFKLAAEVEAGVFDEGDEDELSDDDYTFRSY